MNDYSSHAAGTLLNGTQLAASELPTVRKGGLDPAAVGALLAQAGSALDALHDNVDTLQAEVSTALTERDAAVRDAERYSELLAGDGAGSEADEDELAMTLLSNARQVSARTRAAAQAEAETIVADARAEAEAALAGVEAAHTTAAELISAATETAAQLISDAETTAAATIAEADASAAATIAEAAAAAEAHVAELQSQVAELEARKAAEAADLEAQLNSFRAVAAEAHTRAVGSLQASLSLIEGFVAGNSDAADDVDLELEDAPDAAAETGDETPDSETAELDGDDTEDAPVADDDAGDAADDDSDLPLEPTVDDLLG